MTTKLTPMLMVRDVEASSRWYQRVLDLRSGHGGPDFEMLMEGDRCLLYLHREDAGEHPTLPDTVGETPGRGVLLYIYVGDVDHVYEKAVAAGGHVLDEPHDNALAMTREFSLFDPDGYGLTVAESRPHS